MSAILFAGGDGGGGGGDGGPVDPSGIPLETLTHIRGGLWTVRLNVPLGPRPGRDDNIFAIDYLEAYSSTDQRRGLQAFRDHGYTHGPTGPIIDAGYHGQFPAIDYRANFDDYLDVIQRMYDGGVIPCNFITPDGWSLDRCRAELEPLLRQERCQRLFRIVVLGWEPEGVRYAWTNDQWVARVQWLAEVFPTAVRCLHMVADVDAPTGGDDDKRLAGGNAEAWRRVVPYIHRWFVQTGGYGSGEAWPMPTFHGNFRAYWPDLRRRFHDGYAGWPTTCAVPEPLKLDNAESCSYWQYWNNRPEEESRTVGDWALAAGADGALDGCHVV